MFDDLDEIPEEKILRSCKPYLDLVARVYKDSGLLRPFLHGSENIKMELTKFTFKPRSKPMNSPLRDFEIANKWFQDNFGIKARSETLFVTTTISVANMYGEPHLVFPIGKFGTIHSDEAKDLYLKLTPSSIIEQDFKEEYQEYVKEHGKNPKITYEFVDKAYELYPERYEKAVMDILDGFDYKKNDYRNALLSGSEIMLKTKKFYVIRKTDEMMQFLRDYVEDFS